jgi:hypothetical protein
MAQTGFLYEKNTFKALKSYSIVHGVPACASSTCPDIVLQTANGKTKSGCEMKKTPTAAGSLVMKYYNGKWHFGETDGEDEKEFLKFVGTERNLLTGYMNKKTTPWGKSVPLLQNDPSNPNKKIAKGKPFGSYTTKEKKAFYATDLSKYGGTNEVKINIPASIICDYYIKKECSYMNVGTHGFYTLNGHDDLGLQSKIKKAGGVLIPNFADSVSAQIRIRCQAKSTSRGEYQFTMTLQFFGVSASPYNLAPLVNKAGAAIDIRKLKQSNNQLLIEAFG